MKGGLETIIDETPDVVLSALKAGLNAGAYDVTVYETAVSLYTRNQAAIGALADENNALRDGADIDVLTKAHNRSSYNKKMISEIEKLEKGEIEDIGLILFDLNYFKQINDTHGHIVGDHALTEVTERVRKSLRPGETIYRLGGDEFAIIIENVKNGKMKGIARRLYEASNFVFEYKPQNSGPNGNANGLIPIEVRTSMGVANFGSLRETGHIPREGSLQELAETFAHLTDGALYHSKRNGKDAVGYPNLQEKSNGLVYELMR
jgi:diguanylate cyclase (GGDEF)-like protein